MDYAFFPSVRVRVEGLKQDIQGIIGIDRGEYLDAINQAIDKAIADYDFDGQVKYYVKEAIDRHIQLECQRTQKTRDTISKAIQYAFDKIFDEEQPTG